jgi:H+-transporting ATPase
MSSRSPLSWIRFLPSLSSLPLPLSSFHTSPPNHHYSHIPSPKMRKRHHPHDPERGPPSRTQYQSLAATYDNLDEYTALNQYITTYREPGATAGDEEAEKDARKRPWWAFWRQRPAQPRSAQKAQVVPKEWLETDIRQGLGDEDVDVRRKRCGWNEITGEKESLLKKFLSYFTGPILYGELMALG